MRKIDKFNVIAISETWLSDKDADAELEGYEMFCVNRTNKRGGGVALYMLIQTSNAKFQKYIIKSCVYRTLGSDIDQVKEKIAVFMIS